MHNSRVRAWHFQDDRTGEPKFLEGLKAKQLIEESGIVEEKLCFSNIKNAHIKTRIDLVQPVQPYVVM